MNIIGKKIILQREFAANDKVTFGKMKFDWLSEYPDIYTIELPWKNNQINISCIPQGLYNCIPHNSIDHPNTWRLLNVPNRESILIHIGNYATSYIKNGLEKSSDTKGCILPGFGLDEETPMVQNSTKAMKYLHKIIGTDNFSIEIKN